MTVFLNGSFLPAEEASISIHDRGFLYGDGLFETVRVYNKQPFRWHQHWKRLYLGARFLEIPIPFSEAELLQLVNELIHRDEHSEAMLRVSLTRGPGPRGYSPRGASSPTLLMSLESLAQSSENAEKGWRLLTSQYRVNKEDPLLRYKTCNRLLNIVARQEAETNGADDALLLNQHGEVTETTSANLFWAEGDTIGTPALGAGMLPGITRDLVFELCAELGLSVREEPITVEGLKSADAVFLTLSSWELADVTSLDQHHFSGAPVVARLRQLYRERVRKACGHSVSAQG